MTSILEKNWYNIIEVEPNIYTNGKAFRNIPVSRTLLRNIDVQGLRVLDIGATNGLFSVLLSRKGAHVTAYDRNDAYQDQVNYIKKIYSADFELVNGMSLSDFTAEHHATQKELYDMVFFSGVLYHAYDPTAMVCNVRSLVRNGGIFLMETTCMVDENPALFFNAKGKYFDSCYYQPTTMWMDYICRYTGIRILNTCYTNAANEKIKRLGIVGVVEGARVAEPDDEWMKFNFAVDTKEFNIFTDKTEGENLRSRVRPLDGLKYYSGLDSVDVTRTTQGTPPLTFHEDLCKLKLADTE